MEAFLKKFSAFLVAALVFLQVICLSATPASGFFSDCLTLAKTISSGSVEVIIDNLAFDTAVLHADTSQVFSFSLINNGKSDIEFALDIQIAWDSILDEAGKLLVYPSHISDDDIYQNLTGGDFGGAVIGIADDSKEIHGSKGVSLGIQETVDSGFLAPQSPQASNADSRRDYSFKLFFFENGEVAQNPLKYSGQPFEIGLAARFDVGGRSTGWAATERRFFRCESYIAVTPPVISEVSLPKTFFVTQAYGLDLKAYATAFDENEGDITDRLEISVPDGLKNGKSGEYRVTYSVANSLGAYAVPLTLTFVVWDFVKIEGGSYHALALTGHGRVYSWGNNYYGQLGDGTTSSKSSPVLIDGLSNIIDIAAANDCSFALSADGQIYSWGLNENGRLGDGAAENKSTPSKVLQPDGVYFRQIAAGFATAAAITTEGEVYTWGYGEYGSLGDGGTSHRNAPAKVDGLSGVTKISINRYNGAAITTDGRLFTWGAALHGMLGNGVSGAAISTPALVPYFNDNNIRLKDISVGLYTMAAVSDTGRLFTWGYGADGQLGNGGTDPKSTPQPISLTSKVVIAAAGNNHTGLLTEDGTVLFFGRNAYGQQGNDVVELQLTPALLPNVEGATYLCLAANTSFVLLNSQTVTGMGYGRSGLLGNGGDEHSAKPVDWAFVPPPPQ